MLTSNDFKLTIKNNDGSLTIIKCIRILYILYIITLSMKLIDVIKKYNYNILIQIIKP